VASLKSKYHVTFVPRRRRQELFAPVDTFEFHTYLFSILRSYKQTMMQNAKTASGLDDNGMSGLSSYCAPLPAKRSVLKRVGSKAGEL
jgi:hypothetical protein